LKHSGRSLTSSKATRTAILSRASLGLRGTSIEPNPKAKRSARGYLTEAYAIARAALES
jgi:hypothetical protein